MDKFSVAQWTTDHAPRYRRDINLTASVGTRAVPFDPRSSNEAARLAIEVGSGAGPGVKACVFSGKFAMAGLPHIKKHLSGSATPVLHLDSDSQLRSIAEGTH